MPAATPRVDAPRRGHANIMGCPIASRQFIPALVVAPTARKRLAGIWLGEVFLQGAAASGGVKVNEHLASNHLDATRNVVVLAGQANLSL